MAVLEVKVSTVYYSKLVVESGVFELVESGLSKVKAQIQSGLTRTSFYKYARFLPLRELLLKSEMTLVECDEALRVYKGICEYTEESVVQSALQLISKYNVDFEMELVKHATDLTNAKTITNKSFRPYYKVTDVNGCYLPISILPDVVAKEIPVEIQLLAGCVWSVSTIKPKQIIFLANKSELEGCEDLVFLKSIKMKKDVLLHVYKHLQSFITFEMFFQASELLIATNQRFKSEAMAILNNGWAA